MKYSFGKVLILLLIISNSIFSERGTRARTMHNRTQSSPRSSPSSSSSRPSSYRPTPSRPPSPSGNTNPRPRPSDSTAPQNERYYSSELNTGEEESSVAYETSGEPCATCTNYSSEEFTASEDISRDFVLNSLSVNSRLALTSWDFHFSPAIQYQSKFVPTYELDLNLMGFEFAYMTTLPFQSTGVFREIALIEQKNTFGNSLIESLNFSSYPLIFMKNPILKNLLSIEYRRSAKSATVVANQKLYYFPATTSPGLTEQDSDLGLIFYEEKPAGSQLSYNIKERDWLVTIGFYALRIGFFDMAYSKPYQMDADIYDLNDRLIDQRVFLFEGQATGQGLMLSLQNLFFPTWNIDRLHFSTPDQLAAGFFWGLKEMGIYWGSGSIRLQNGIDLVEKYRAFYQNETGHEPSVAFFRKVFHVMIGYKFNAQFRLYAEYRYTDYSLTLEDSYQDGSYNYFLNHAINRDTIQQFAINLTSTF